MKVDKIGIAECQKEGNDFVERALRPIVVPKIERFIILLRLSIPPPNLLNLRLYPIEDLVGFVFALIPFLHITFFPEQNHGAHFNLVTTLYLKVSRCIQFAKYHWLVFHEGSGPSEFRFEGVAMPAIKNVSVWILDLPERSVEIYKKKLTFHEVHVKVFVV